MNQSSLMMAVTVAEASIAASLAPESVPAYAAVTPRSFDPAPDTEAATEGQAVLTTRSETDTAPMETEYALAIQRATAEQARRVAQQQRLFLDRLLTHLAQPCFVLDREARILFWNVAAEDWTRLSAAEATGSVLMELFCPQAQSRLKKAFHAVLTETDQEAFALPGTLALLCGATAAQLTLLPLRRIADYVELVVVLAIPLRSTKRE